MSGTETPKDVQEAERLWQWSLQKDRDAYPEGPLAKGRSVYNVIAWEGCHRGALLLSDVEKQTIEDAFAEASRLARPSAPATDAESERLRKAAEGALREIEDEEAFQGFKSKAGDQLREALAARPSDPQAVEEARRIAEEDALDAILGDLARGKGFWNGTDCAANVLQFYGAMLPADRQRARDGQSEGGA